MQQAVSSESSSSSDTNISWYNSKVSVSTKNEVTVERQSPEAAFGLLSNDLRVRILQALSEAGEPIAFSRLRKAVDERDSGKFNYHLGKLVGHLVVHDDDGYRLSLAGRKVYGAIISGAYTTDAEIEPFEFEGPCPVCGAEHLVAGFTDECAKMHCDDCEGFRNEFSFPPASLEQFTREELPYAFDRWMRAMVSKVVHGFCSNCGGRVDGRLHKIDDSDYPMPVQAHYDCKRCGDTVQSSPALPLMFQAVAIEYFADHGVDLVNDPSWKYFTAEDDVSIEIVNDEPVQAQIQFSLSDESLVAIVDSNVKVESVTIE
jgi:hypothetical protein